MTTTMIMSRRISMTMWSLFLLLILSVGANHDVFNVKYKYAHDFLRQLSLLTSIEFPLGGSGRPDAVRTYYAKIGIGTPSKDYYLLGVTGSDIMWVNCI